MGMNLAQKEKADGTELIATLTSCQLPLPVVNGESEYLVHGNRRLSLLCRILNSPGLTLSPLAVNFEDR